MVGKAVGLRGKVERSQNQTFQEKFGRGTIFFLFSIFFLFPKLSATEGQPTPTEFGGRALYGLKASARAALEA